MWLPGRNSTRTNSAKTLCELTPYYTRAYSKGCLFIRGKKPKELARIAKISARRWRQHQNDEARENPILKGQRYLRVFEQESIKTYAQAAEKIGVSRQRVYQFVSLVTGLPQEIQDFLITNEDPALLALFTERRLRPLTTMATEDDKIECFQRMLVEATHGAGSANEACRS